MIHKTIVTYNDNEKNECQEMNRIVFRVAQALFSYGFQDGFKVERVFISVSFGGSSPELRGPQSDKFLRTTTIAPGKTDKVNGKI
jgi:hypothetical protein